MIATAFTAAFNANVAATSTVFSPLTSTAFTPTTAGLDYAESNYRHAASGVQVFETSMGFYVAIPASVRHTGIRAVGKTETSLQDALLAAEAHIEAGIKRMNRLHAAALRMNAALAA